MELRWSKWRSADLFCSVNINATNGRTCRSINLYSSRCMALRGETIGVLWKTVVTCKIIIVRNKLRSCETFWYVDIGVESHNGTRGKHSRKVHLDRILLTILLFEMAHSGVLHFLSNGGAPNVAGAHGNIRSFSPSYDKSACWTMLKICRGYM